VSADAVPAVTRVSADTPTIGAARHAAIAELRAAGIETPELDARVLFAEALSLDHAAFAAADGRVLNVEQRKNIAAVIRRRIAGEPVARIVGYKEFWSLRLRVGPATLVPRPETETIVETALAAIDAGGPRTRPLRIADLGTGSGAILLALLSELKDAFGVGSDINPRALVVARDNARRLGLRRAAFVACDLAAALAGPFDLIVSNPPYIASGDIATLAPEVRLFDPRLALDGGTDGLSAYRAIAAAAPALLATEGSLVVELGVGQAEPVAAIFDAVGLVPSAPYPDLNGVPRVLIASKKGASHKHSHGRLDGR
jgi:release factor glutamine methyltransferase